MIIRSLRLQNIRSYIDEKIIFPEGSILLSGDIGCGKTTILLAMEFAIFGIMKGLVSGSMLLRHGASTGSVELELSIEKQDIMIKRTLKKGHASIVQDSGTLTINGKSFEGTPQELKSRMLELLGYPEALLTKSKSLIFRYTVFTPQEDMKRIIYENREDRLDTLRRLFNIDKYKTIRENAIMYSKGLKTQQNTIQGRIESLPAKKKEMECYIKEQEKILSSIETEIVKSRRIASEFEHLKSELSKIEKEYEEIRAEEQELALKKNELQSVIRQDERLKAETAKITLSVNESLKDFEGFDPAKADESRARLAAKKKELESVNSKLSELISKRSEYATRKNASEIMLKKIVSLDRCPTCLQSVNEQHKNEVQAKEKTIINGCDANLHKIEELMVRFKDKRTRIEQEIELYLKGEKEFATKKVKLELIEEKKLRKKTLEKELDELKEATSKLKTAADKLQAKLEQEKGKKTLVEKAKKDLESKREDKIMHEKMMLEMETKLKTLKKITDSLNEEITRLSQEEENLTKLKERTGWLEDEFIRLVEQIENATLIRVHEEFNQFFQEWFNMLIEDETISVRLDDGFSPVIEQNGYETWIENLSGGEKTSIALAYRLSLNKVINDFMSSIRTRDLLILDEPTEGFSTEQLDRVREVLSQTNVKQTIIVSHETKMEGVVDSIVRIKKHDHASKANPA